MRIISGIILVAIGALITIYANKVHEALGPVAWAEEHFGVEGGSRLFYKLVGIGFCVFGFLLMTGLLSELALGLIRILFPGAATKS